MDLRQLEAFVAVATLGSFKAAANRLSLTQPAISARISALESYIGEDLFLRDMRPIGLSDRAKRMLPYAEQMLELSQHIRPGIFSTSSGAVERLRIGTNSSLVNGWLPQLSWRLHQAMPHVTLEYEVDASHRLRDRMRSGALDVCLMHASTDIAGVRRHHICDIQAIWAARPDVVPHKRLSIDEMMKRHLITFGSEARSFMLFDATLRTKGLVPPAHLSTNYVDIIINHIKHSDFIGMLLRDSIIHELRSGSLIEVKTEFPLELYPLHVCYPITKSKAIVRKCIDEIISFSEHDLPIIRGSTWA